MPTAKRVTMMMTSSRIRLLVGICLVSLSCGFTVSRPVAIRRSKQHQNHPSLGAPALALSSSSQQPQDNDDNDIPVPSFDPELRRIMGSIATLGVLETTVLTYSKLAGPSLDICGTAGDCASVLNGPYSTIPFTNIPLASLGLIAYLTTTYLALEPVLLERDDSDFNRMALLATTTAMGTFSVFLLSLIYGILQTSCLYCVASAILSITLACCAWFGGCVPETPNEKRGVQAGIASIVATTLAAVLLFLSVDNMPLNNVGVDSMSSTLMASTTTTSQVQQQQPQQQQEMSPPDITTTSSQRALTLSQDLQSLNAKMYGAYWCSHCYDQKQSLGKQAFSRIEYLECAPEGKNSQRQACKERDVPGYPTWEINGKLYPGEREIEELEDIVKEIGLQ